MIRDMFLVYAAALMASFMAMTNACDNIASITVTENIPYPSRSLLDVAKVLHDKLITTDSDKDNIYLTDLTGSKPFVLSNGGLSVSGFLDREQICSKEKSEQRLSTSRCCVNLCCMFIGITTAQDKTVFIKVVIEDENDNEPTFPQSTLKILLHENVEQGHYIQLPKAEDLDSSIYGIERYEIVQDKDCMECFQMKYESRGGEPSLITKTKIDREQNSVFHLQVLAVDRGVPSKTGSLSVIIEVDDINDNSPVFEETSISLNVEENGLSGREIKNLKVTDADVGSNSQTSYEISDYSLVSQKYFRLSYLKNGVSIMLQSTLDYESIKTFKFLIIARDHGTPSLSSTATIMIQVTNVNDERPEILFYQRGIALDPHNILQLPENGPKQKTVIQVHVSDKDSKLSEINCDVSNPRDVFYLHDNQQTILYDNKKIFDLQSSVIFDREVINLYRIGISCSDSNSNDKLTNSVEIKLRITDENDNPPIFSSNIYFGNIIETNSLDKIVDLKDGSIKVSDADVDVNSRITFSLADFQNSSDSKSFSMAPNYPQIKNIAPIDFEGKKKYVFIVVAQDCGNPVLSSSATLTIHVLDANDNRPEISKKYYSFTVFEEQPIGTEIGRIEVTDADSDQKNKDFIFEIVSHEGSKLNSRPNKLFVIENNTGSIKTRVSLDREKDQHINFLVKVRNTNEDSSNQGRLDLYGNSVSVNIKIEDINDNKPKLVLKDNPNMEVSVANILKGPAIVIDNEALSTPNHCALFPYTFTDADEGLNSEVKVTLKDNQYFHLEMGHNLICPNRPNIAAGPYSIYVMGEDRNGDTGCLRSESVINVVVKTGSQKKQQTNKKNHQQDLDEKSSEYKTVIIFIVLIATIILFCLLLIVVVVKTKLCIPRNISLVSRNREKIAEKQNNSGSNQLYSMAIPGGGGKNKRLYNDYIRSSLEDQNGLNLDFSKNLLFQRPDPSGQYFGEYPGQGTLPNKSQSCESMFPENVDPCQSPNQNQPLDARYEQLIRTTGKFPSAIVPNWDKTQNYQYNYLLEPRDSGSLPNSCGNTTPLVQDLVTIAPGYKKSINDVYLQTSFV